VTLLALDIGNSATKAGLFQGKRLLAWDKIATASKPAALKFWLKDFLGKRPLKLAEVDAVALGSVVPTATVFWEDFFSKHRISPLVLTGASPTRLKVNYHPRRSLGADRLANALAASYFYRPPVICVSLGTATVVDAVSAQGEFLGGAIMPGLELFGEALAARTILLPKTNLSKKAPLIGDSTKSSLEAGMIHGSGFALQGLVKAYRKQLGPRTKLVVTGGSAPLILPLLFGRVYHRPTLTLEGIRLAWEDVRGKSK